MAISPEGIEPSRFDPSGELLLGRSARLGYDPGHQDEGEADCRDQTDVQNRFREAEVQSEPFVGVSVYVVFFCFHGCDFCFQSANRYSGYIVISSLLLLNRSLGKKKLFTQNNIDSSTSTAGRTGAPAEVTLKI